MKISQKIKKIVIAGKKSREKDAQKISKIVILSR
jgi:hypothetical protein